MLRPTSCLLLSHAHSLGGPRLPATPFRLLHASRALWGDKEKKDDKKKSVAFKDPPPGTKWTKKWEPKEEKKNAPLTASDAKKLIRRLSPEDRLVLRDVLLSKSPLPAPEFDAASDANDGAPVRPSVSSLYHLAFHQSLPFIGFGFLDNLIMILAGEYIDHHIGLTLGISTMAAAALGNTISDVFGIGSASFVEGISTKLGASPPPLTLEQLEMPVSRVAANLGRALGVALGCLLGMFPLLFQ